jgi:hypothetical protein
MRVRPLLVAAALSVGAVPAVDAFAHNGIGAAFKGRAGGYIVYAYDGELLPSGRLDYKLVVLNARTKNPVYDAHPSVTATRPGDSPATAAISPFGNVFFYNLPNPYPHDWDVHLRITGPLGAGSVRYRMHGAAPTAQTAAPVVVSESGSSNWPLIIGAVGGAVVLAGVVFFVLKRSAPRRRASP